MRWIEETKKLLYNAYKQDILKRPQKGYTYIRMVWSGDKFGLCLAQTRKDNWDFLPVEGWDKFENSIESTIREIESIPSDEFDEEDDCYYEVEFSRKEWPFTQLDCFELERFLMSVVLGLTYLELKNEKKLSAYLAAIETVEIYSVSQQLAAFSNFFPDESVRKDVIGLLSDHPNNQKLIFDLWADQLKKEGASFLQKLTSRDQENAASLLELKLEKAFQKAEELYKKGGKQMALDLLLPQLEPILDQRDSIDWGLIEKSCNLVGNCYRFKSKNNFDKAAMWFQKGVEYLPYGASALNLLSLYKFSLKDFEALVHFGEKHLEHATKNDKDYTYHSYNYLAYGYTQTGKDVKAHELYKKIHKMFKHDISKMRKTISQLDDIQNTNTMAKKILKGFNNH
ncbi:tetratricopeptide repeat protein [Flagellimonas lutimaris]|uniref:Tetratricopeptide repeat protein n=1 Tax=Flagellimonas lutimaris TaxID=475082 RepID=A0A3A1NEP1_9FLAO|nr:tetratricopeptide repeat protein [Allomuricauda lutimaris]RIV36680.1 tetratricopeptide repeat protein [Allomuricauda lutimaris]